MGAMSAMLIFSGSTGFVLRRQVSVTNPTGRSVKATAMWYVSAESDRIARPERELRYFDKQEVKGGETVTFRWTIDPLRDLGYVDSDSRHFLTAGTYTLTMEGRSTTITVPETMAVGPSV